MAEMKADKHLTDDLNKAGTFEDLRAILENAVERSPELGLTRDLQTGQFVSREKPAAPSVRAAEADKEITKKEIIGGKEFSFTGTPLEVEQAIGNALKVAEAVRENARPVAQQPHEPTQEELDLDAAERAEWDLKFKRGDVDAATYLEKTGVIAEALRRRGFDVDEASARMYQQNWAEATTTFKTTPAGADWPGGQKNVNLMGMKLIELGLLDADDKVAALAQAYSALKDSGMLMQDVSEQRLIEMTEGMTPQEILEAFKEAHGGDSEKANEAFLKIHGASSSIFGK